jgi:signal transduction histidine kinase/ligand-binding sensor domain-containing protein
MFEVNGFPCCRGSRWWFPLAALLWCGCAAALSPHLTIKELHHTAWGPGQGAPLGGAVALAQTTDGYMWIAGPAGLFRFDGTTFERIELPHDPKLSAVSLMSAFAPRSGGLWVGFTFGGVARLKDGRWQVFSTADGLPPSTPWDFAEARDGTIWVATSADVARFDGTHWQAVGHKMGFPANNYNSILFVDSQDTIWAGNSKSLFYLPAGEHQFRERKIAVPTPWQGSSMTESGTGAVWLDTGFYLVPVAQNPPSGQPRSSSRGGIVFDADGALWATVDGLRRIVHPERAPLGSAVRTEDVADTYGDADGLTSRTVFAFKVDREGNIWAGTTHGLDRFSEPILLTPLQSAQNQKIMPRIVIAGIAPADGTGGLWVTNGLDAVVRYRDGRMEPPIITQNVQSLLHGADGTTWFGGEDTVWSERQGRVAQIRSPNPGVPIQALALDGSGNLWASASGSGVYQLKGNAWTPFGGIAGLPRKSSINVVLDRLQRLWFSYIDGTVAVLEGGKIESYGPRNGLQIGTVLAIYSGKNDEWFGGELGLARFVNERFQTVLAVPELPLDGVTGVVEGTDGDLWINCRAGIIHIAASELERNRRSASYRVNGETFGAADGVVGSGSTLRPLPTAIKAGDGTLWFATTGGIYGIDPARRPHNGVPPVVLIREITVAGRGIDPAAPMTLPSYTTAVRFDYLGLSLTAAEKVRYRYRLDGVDDTWRPITTARQAFYTNLRPGRYVFHVVAANNDGVWNEAGASSVFTIPQAFVQTPWFIALCVIGGIVALWSLVRLRVRQVRHRLEERMVDRMNERNRISRELHDSLLQGFQGLMFRLQAVRQLLPERAVEAVQFLESTMQAGDQAIGEGRNAVENLRSTTFDDRDIATSLSALNNEMDAGIGGPLKPAYRVVVEGKPRELTAVIRNEAYRIAREAVFNGYRHANAANIETEVTFADTEFRIRVRDDGIGVDPQILAQGQRPGHWGLPGMRERSESFGGQLHLWSEGGAGTEIELRIPAQIAYARPPMSVANRLSAWARKIYSAVRRPTR